MVGIAHADEIIDNLEQQDEYKLLKKKHKKVFSVQKSDQIFAINKNVKLDVKNPMATSKKLKAALGGIEIDTTETDRKKSKAHTEAKALNSQPTISKKDNLSEEENEEESEQATTRQGKTEPKTNKGDGSIKGPSMGAKNFVEDKNLKEKDPKEKNSKDKDIKSKVDKPKNRKKGLTEKGKKIDHKFDDSGHRFTYSRPPPKPANQGYKYRAWLATDTDNASLTHGEESSGDEDTYLKEKQNILEASEKGYTLEDLIGRSQARPMNTHL